MSQQLSYEVQREIEKVKCGKTTVLNLYGNKINNIDFLKELTNLTWLNLSANRIVDVSILSNLLHLTNLYLASNQIIDLSSLSNLDKLEILDLNSNRIENINYLSDLNNLRTLDLRSNQIKNLNPLSNLNGLDNLLLSSNQIVDISPLSGLHKVANLSLNSNQIVDISPLSSLYKMTNLSLSSNQIVDINPLSGLHKVTNLSLKSNQIIDLNPLSDLYRLTKLYLDGNQISSVYPLAVLDKLTRLYLSSNQLVDVSPLSRLNKLTLLDLSENYIDEIPISLIQFQWSPYWEKFGKGRYKNGIYLKDNPLLTPPPEIIQQGNEAIATFFEEINNTRPLNEVKVILVGEGAVGKTSVVNRLFNKDFNIQESQTQGIHISKTDFVYEEGEKLKIHFWDFGGQEIMHATHQFFLTKRCVYLLVLDSRRDQKTEYWLRHIESFGGDARIIIILNKTDENPSFDLNRQFLQNKYPNIIAFYKVSCKNNIGIEQLKAALKQQLWNLELRKSSFPNKWWQAKEALENMQEDYISFKDYQQLCRKNHVHKANAQKVLLGFLNDLGIIFNYEKLHWYDTHVLNPLWLTNAVYRIINSPIVAENNGRFCMQELDAIINDSRYKNLSNDKEFHVPTEKYRFIVAMMQSFELVYKIDEHNYIFPELLPVEANNHAFAKEAKVLHFIVEYPDFLPTSIFPRLMVRQHKYILEGKAWRTGMVLQENLIVHSTANVVLDKEKRQIHFHITGKRSHDFLSILRNTLKEIHQDFQNLDVEEWIPLPEKYKGETLLVEYQELIGYEEARQPNYFSGKLRKAFSVKDLLNGVERPEERQSPKQKQDPCTIFICYHSKDEAYKEALNKHLMLLVRLKKVVLWDQSHINGGERYKETIFKELNNADLVLCLISNDFIADDFCYSEQLAQAMAAEKEGKKKVVPIQMRKYAWKSSPLGKQKALPENSWVGKDPNNDEAWVEVVEGIEKLIEQQWKGRWTK